MRRTFVVIGLLAVIAFPPGFPSALTAAAPPSAVAWPIISLRYVAPIGPEPTALAAPADGSGRLFVTERSGRIRFLRNGTLVLFMDISDRVITRTMEQGLLALAFPPNFAASPYFYVLYTHVADQTVRLSRFRAQGDAGLPDTEEPIMTFERPGPNGCEVGYHNGGHLAFGPDGLLWISMGDGACSLVSGGEDVAQYIGPDADRLLGKLLRIQVAPNLAGYAVPATNPLIRGVRNEVWAYGLRNPWRFSFDSNGDLYLADPGEDAWEEINWIPAGSSGQNFGWSCREGPAPFREDRFCAPPLTDPVVAYDHSLGFAVVGGYVYRGPRSSLQGLYFYGDWGTGRLWAMQRDGATWVTRLLRETGLAISTFGVDQAGNLYFADYRSGGLWEILDDAPVGPHLRRAPALFSQAGGGW